VNFLETRTVEAVRGIGRTRDSTSVSQTLDTI
jgi:hypothetical protein